jgi:hypothetical protein
MIADAMVDEDGTAHHVYKINGNRSRFLDKAVLRNLTNKKSSIVGARNLKRHIDNRTIYEIYKDQEELVA